MSWTVDQLDLRVAERLCRLVRAEDPSMVTLAALAAGAPRGGHVCIDLASLQQLRVNGNEPQVVLERRSATGAGERPEPEPLTALGDVARLLEDAVASGLARHGEDDSRDTPLVVDGSRVYLDRYWTYEDRLHQQLVERSAAAGTPSDPDVVRGVLDRVAAHDEDGPAVDRQRLAVANGLLRTVSVLSGGPGTGKTHTVVSLLAATVLLAEARDQAPPRIAIAAPTGKAAARLEEAITDAVRDRGLPQPAVDVLSALQGHTLHRLLGWQRWSPTRFRHDVDNPLPHDLVVVDEASMVPLSLMAKLVEAVRPTATLVLVGDRNQLTSVEAGAVLGDVCGPPVPHAPTAPHAVGSSLRLSDAWARTLADVTGEPVDGERAPMPDAGVWDGIVQLERFRRFGPDTGIGAVARAVQRVPDDGIDRDADEVLAFCTGGRTERGAAVETYTDVALLAPEDPPALPRSLREDVTGALQPYLDAVFAAGACADDDHEGFRARARVALEALDAVRVLCAVREGPLGVRSVGEQVGRWVAAADGRLDLAEEWYVGRPVLVTRNDYDLGVMNGDVGVTLERGGRRVVVFRTAGGEVQAVPAIRVADCETVWAMTIHKSQGSQFDHAVVVLTERETDVVTRELLYTGVTRARQRVTIVASEPRLRAAVLRPVRRATGLRERLWT